MLITHSTQHHAQLFWPSLHTHLPSKLTFDGTNPVKSVLLLHLTSCITPLPHCIPDFTLAINSQSSLNNNKGNSQLSLIEAEEENWLAVHQLLS